MPENSNKIINHGHRHRLQKRFEQTGFDGFSEHEVVELLLTLCIPRKDVKAIAKTLLKNFDSIRGVFDAKIEDLTQIKGIGPATAIALKIIRAVNNLYLQKKFESGEILDSTRKVFALWKNRLSGLEVETVEVAYLDSSLRLMKNGIERLETGTVSAAVIYPRKIAETALIRKSTAVIIAHNHPSGPAEPSDCDERNTQRIKIALQYLDIKLIDHVIISKNDAFSFHDHGLL